MQLLRTFDINYDKYILQYVCPRLLQLQFFLTRSNSELQSITGSLGYRSSSTKKKNDSRLDAALWIITAAREQEREVCIAV